MKKLVIGLFLLFTLFIMGCAKPTQVVPSQAPEVVTKAPEVQTSVTQEIKGLVLLTTFETGKEEGWQPLGEKVKISVSDKVAHSGKFSLFVEGRTAGWNGAQIPLKAILQPGKTYNISVWVYQESGSAQKMILTMRRKYSTDEKTQYEWIKDQIVPNKKWTEFSGSYSIPKDVTIVDLALYIEAPDDINLTYYVDDLVITEKTSSFKLTPEFLTLISKYIK